MPFPLSERLSKLLQGYPWGRVFPPRPSPPPLTVDGRTAALRILRDYISELTFLKENAPGMPPIKICLPKKNIRIEWPDYEVDLVTPSIAVTPGTANYGFLGFGSHVDEASWNVFAPKTVLIAISEVTETITLEIWCSTIQERRAIISGMEAAFTPVESMYGIRFKMPDYYNEMVCFTLNQRALVEDEMSAQGRRRAHMMFEMRYNQVALVNVEQMYPTVDADVE